MSAGEGSSSGAGGGSSLEEQILRAVDIAAGSPSGGPLAQDPAVRQQALEFLNSLQSMPDKCWLPGWNVFAAGTGDAGKGPGGGGEGKRENHQARMFGLQLVNYYLDNA